VKVLVADDNLQNRRLIADTLSVIDCEVVMATNGEEALALVAVTHPDLVILDVNMPLMSGFDVCERLKGDPETVHIPVIMLTALKDVENRVRGLVLGADDYLTKPFNPRELMERVQKLIRSKMATEELRETQQLIRNTFERFVSPQVVEHLLQDVSQVRLGGLLQEVTVMFTDLEGFTSMSEQTEPQKLLHVLNSYHTMVVGAVRAYDGTVDKFMGDGVMSLYNTPLPQPDHAERAVRTALYIQEQLPAFHEQFEPVYRLGINVGIHTGMAVVGNVGAPEIMDFTAVGDTVNLAARLQQISSGGRILISRATYEQTVGVIETRPIGLMNVKGRVNQVMTYEVLGLAEAAQQAAT
jgi:class 3 adenylate cyclase